MGSWEMQRSRGYIATTASGTGPQVADGEEEILKARASAGSLVLAHSPPDAPFSLQVKDFIQVNSTIDNPSYFHEPYAAHTGRGRGASGYILVRLWRAAAFPDSEGSDPAMVWLVQAARPSDDDELGELGKGDGAGNGKKEGKGAKGAQKYKTTMLFRDDGLAFRSASAAVLVAIDPRENEGKKEAWLFVTGPVARRVVVCRVEL
jgi:hypothetical protein